MKTAIIFASTYGFTEKCVSSLKEKLTGEVEVMNLKNNEPKDLAGFDQVIVGGSVYMGQMQKKVKTFAIKHEQELLSKRLGLFACCGGYEVAEQQLKTAFNDSLFEKAVSIECFGGVLEIDKLNFFHKQIMKMVAKSKDNKPMLPHLENIDKMADTMNEAR